MGRCRYFKSVSVFRYTGRYFFKSVRYLLSVFQNFTISVRYFWYFTLRILKYCFESVPGFWPKTRVRVAAVGRTSTTFGLSKGVIFNDLEWPKPRFRGQSIFRNWNLGPDWYRTRYSSSDKPVWSISDINALHGFVSISWVSCRPMFYCRPLGLVKNTFSTMRTLPIPIDSDSSVKEPHDNICDIRSQIFLHRYN